MEQLFKVSKFHALEAPTLQEKSGCGQEEETHTTCGHESRQNIVKASGDP